MWPFIWTNLSPLHLRMLCPKFGWNWHSGFGEDFKYHQCILANITSPLKKGMALHLNKLESLSLKNVLCPIRLKLAQWFCRKIFLNFLNVFSLFHNYLPLEKSLALHLKKLESQDETPPFRENWKAPFSHLSVTIQTTDWQVHFSDHSVTILSPFSYINFPLFQYITDLICIISSYILF